MKRKGEVDSITMTNFMMFVSHGGEFETNYNNSSNNHVYECKTCKRWFPSFQALGGHRASHKKPRLMMVKDRDIDNQLVLNSQSLSKPKTHECSICGLEFALGQALGGHMRRHRTSNFNGNMQNNTTTMVLDLNLTPFENDLKVLKIAKIPTLVEYL
ncbi:hypothetical protein TanjilG_11926 [Lupinus angustifolius]|uniref:C2H2-type domain-containing protein n=1 Tax=Lupinus angustifolius TaxID=3871 RepID=A0A1J7H3X0_LUPAN|nr:PREDICTED: zinc finger protein ZAT11-like [Lupinus angustifolius]OIW07292.1 hypothetical protein TanjilG_11926 [Lupinus angustifolius]